MLLKIGAQSHVAPLQLVARLFEQLGTFGSGAGLTIAHFGFLFFGLVGFGSGAGFGLFAVLFRDTFVPRRKRAAYDAAIARDFGLLFFGSLAAFVLVIIIAYAIS